MDGRDDSDHHDSDEDNDDEARPSGRAPRAPSSQPKLSAKEESARRRDAWVDAEDHIDRPPYTGPPPTFILPDGFDVDSPLAWFKLFFTDAMVDRIVTATNAHLKPSPEEALTREQFEIFLGVALWFAVDGPEQMQLAWKQDYIRYVISDAVTRDWFLNLMANFHLIPPFDDDEKVDAEKRAEARKADRLYTIRWLLDDLQQNFRAVFVPGEFICVDETMVASKHHTAVQQYMKVLSSKYSKIGSIWSRGI